MYDINSYHKSLRIKAFIKILDETHALTGEDKRMMQRRSHPASWSRLALQIGDDAAHALKHMYSAYCSELRATRSVLRNPPNQRPSLIEDIVNRGLHRARTAVNMMFSTHSFSVLTSATPSFAVKTTFYGEHKVGIPKSWLRTVHERDLTGIKGSDGDRFILSAKERRSPQLVTEIYEVIALKKNTPQDAVVHGAFSLEDGWVARANGISAYSTEAHKALRLLNRRVRAKIMEAFLGE